LRTALRASLALAAVLAVQLTAAAAELPAGWFKDGKAPRQFRAGVDTAVNRHGGASAYLQSWTAAPPVYGTVMQRVDAERYRGKRVRFEGWLRTEAVDHDDGWAGLWLRIDGPAGSSLAFDNSEEEPVRETAEWTRVAVVLDVEDRAEALAFGFMLVGSGKVWADDLAFEVVGRDVPVTAVPRRELPKEPVNLGFEG
jgi:hypothetical protein